MIEISIEEEDGSRGRKRPELSIETRQDRTVGREKRWVRILVWKGNVNLNSGGDLWSSNKSDS